MVLNVEWSLLPAVLVKTICKATNLQLDIYIHNYGIRGSLTYWQSQIVGNKGEMIETIELLIHQV